MRLNQSRSISAIEQGAPLRRGAGDLLVQHPHDAAAVERAGQFVEFGELLDPLVGFLELQPALVERLLHRAGEDAEEHAAPDGQDEHQHGGEALEVAAVRHRDRLVGQQEQPGQADRHRGPDHRGLRAASNAATLKLNTMNSVQRNNTPTSGAI